MCNALEIVHKSRERYNVHCLFKTRTSKRYIPTLCRYILVSQHLSYEIQDDAFIAAAVAAFRDAFGAVDSPENNTLTAVR